MGKGDGLEPTGIVAGPLVVRDPPRGPCARGPGVPLVGGGVDIDGPARLERLARDTLFGLFEGHLRSLEIIQPLENLHFEPPKPEFIDGQRVLDVGGYRESLKPSPDNSASFAVSLVAQPACYTFRIEDRRA